MSDFKELVKNLYTSKDRELTPEKFDYIQKTYAGGKEQEFVKNFYETIGEDLTQDKLTYITDTYLKKKEPLSSESLVTKYPSPLQETAKLVTGEIFGDISKGIAAQEQLKPKPKAKKAEAPHYGQFIDIGQPIAQEVDKSKAVIPESGPMPWVMKQITKGQIQGKIANILSAGKRPTIDELGEIATLNKELQSMPRSEAEIAFEKDGFGIFKKNPLLGVQFLGETMLSSLSSLAESGKRTVPTAVGMGAAMGAPIAGIGAVAGAATGLTAGLLTGGYNISTSQDILNSLSDNGVDISDKDSLINAFSDEKRMAKIRSTAAKYGVPILAFDALTSGIAGKLIGGAVGKSLSKKIIAGMGEAGIQAVGGSGGELAGQLASGKKVNWDEVALEGVASLATDVPDIAVGAMIERRNASSNNKTLATQIAVQGNEAGLEDAKINLNRDLKNGVISEKEYQDGLAFAQKAAEINTKIPEPVQGENRATSIELIAERDRLSEELIQREEQKKGIDVAYHKALDEANEEVKKRIDEINNKIIELSAPTEEIITEEIKPESQVIPLQEEVESQVITEQPITEELTPKTEEYAIFQPTAGEIPIQPEAAISEEVEGRKPKTELEEIAPIKSDEEKVAVSEFGDLSKMTDKDIENRMTKIENDNSKGKEFDFLEKEMEKRERATIFNVSLDKVNDAIDALIIKEKDMPNGWGAFIEPRDARETKEIADKYLNAKSISDVELKKDFKDAVFGRPDSWYADGLKLRESIKEAANRGIDTQEMVREIELEFERDGYTAEEARKMVARKLAPIFKGSESVQTSESKLLTSAPKTEKIEPQKITKEKRAEPTKETGEKAIKEPPPPPKNEEAEGEEFSKKMRSFYKNIIERAKGITESQRELLRDNPNALYDVLPHAESRKIAEELIEELGVDEAVLEATKKTSNLQPVERVMILGAAMDYYAKVSKEKLKSGDEAAMQKAAENEIDAQEKMQNIAKELGTLGTDFGRAISIFNEVYKLSNLALERKLKLKVDQVNKSKQELANQQSKEIKKIVTEDKDVAIEAANDLTEAELMRNADAIRKISDLEKEVADLKKQILERDKAQVGTKKNPLKIKRITNDTEYDKRVKEFQQRQRSIISKDDISDLTYFGLYHIENGITKFADWYEVMNKKFKGFKDKLPSIYTSVRDKAIENGADEKLFDNQDSINKTIKEINAKKLQEVKDLINEQIKEVRRQIIEKDQKQKKGVKKQQDDLEITRLREQLSDLEGLRDNYIPELPETYDFEKKRERFKERLINDIIDINEQINAGEKRKSQEKEKYEGDKEIDTFRKIKEKKQKILNKLSEPTEAEKQAISDAKKMALATKKVAVSKFKEAMNNNPNRARIQAPKIAAERIRKDAERNLDMPSTKVEQTYLKKLVQTINTKAKEYYKETKQNVKNINDILAFAIANSKSDYKIWERTKEEVERQIDQDTSLTDEQKSDAKEFLEDYTESIFDTLLTTNQIDQLIREKLIENGYGTEKIIKGKLVKAVDWNKVTSNEKNRQEAKSKIIKAINDLGFNDKNAKAEIDAILTQFDNKILDKKTAGINALLNKGVLNKVKSALGVKKVSKSQVGKLIEMNNKGILDDVRVKDVLADELGLVSLSKDDLARVRELSSLIDNPNIPEFMRKQFQEQLQYLFDSKGGNLMYLENREFTNANRLSSLYNQIQNMTGLTRPISTLFTVGIKTGNFGKALKVYLTETLNSIQDAKTILIKGRVSRGTSFSDLTMTTEGEVRTRYLEYSKGKIFGGAGLGKSLYAKLGGKTVDVNLLNQAYSKTKFINRLLESVDTIGSGQTSGLTRFWQITKYINKFYPELSSKQKSQKIWDMLYSIDRAAERPNAIKSLEEAGIKNPSESEINRTINEKAERNINKLIAEDFYRQVESLKPMAKTALRNEGNENPTADEITSKVYKLLGTDEPLDVVARGERQAARETGKLTTVGITSLLITPLDLIQRGISQKLRKNTTTSGRLFANGSDAAISYLFPYVHSIGRWLEMQLELTPYGYIKSAVYKSGLAKAIEGADKAKFTKEEYSELGDDYAIRATLGISYEIIGMYAISLANMLAGEEEDKDKEKVIGTAKKEKFPQERVQSVGKPKQSINIAGYNIPLQIFGNSGISMGMYADAMKYMKDPDYQERSILYVSAMVLMENASSQWFESTKRYGGIASALTKGQEEKYAPALGKIFGSIAGSQIPYNRFQTEMATVLNPQSKSSIDFGVNVLNQMSIFKSFTPQKPNFDYRGRTYDYGDIFVNSADGVVKMFKKAKGADEADEFLSKINFAATDAYRETKDMDNYNFAIIEDDGKKRSMTPDEYYVFKFKTAKLFNEYILKSYKYIDGKTILDNGIINKEETLKFKKQFASFLLTEAKKKGFAQMLKEMKIGASMDIIQKLEENKLNLEIDMLDKNIDTKIFLMENVFNDNQ